jgi:DinB family protein
MYRQNLELLRSTRCGTLRLCSGITQAQSEFSLPGKWSAGEVLHHLVLADDLYRRNFARLIELQKCGETPVLRSSFSDLNTSIAYIPKSFLPMLEIPFTVVNLFVPSVLRETMTQFRLLPAQNPDITTPTKGLPVTELRDALQASCDQIGCLFDDNPQLNYRGMRYQHPIMGSNSVLQMLRIAALHERRHQSQIRDILRSRQFPKVA